ncbi:hypothetical protein Tco_0533573 [Tanacetum coccineum]
MPGKDQGQLHQLVPPPVPETIPETRPESDQPQDHLSTTPRQDNLLLSSLLPCLEHGSKAVTVDSNIPPDGASDNPAASSYFSTDVPTGGDFAHHHPKILSMEKRETRQAEVLSSAKHYSDTDWIDIMAQVHANAGLSFELLGADVNDDNFAERMVALINQRKRVFAEQTAKEKRDKPMTPPTNGNT